MSRRGPTEVKIREGFEVEMSEIGKMREMTNSGVDDYHSEIGKKRASTAKRWQWQENEMNHALNTCRE